MNWMSHNPQRNYTTGASGGDVKISYTSHTNKRNGKIYHTANILVKQLLAQKVGWKRGDRLSLSVDTTDYKKIKLELTQDGTGWLISHHRTLKDCHRIQISWPFPVPTNRGLQTVAYETLVGGLLLYLDKIN